MKQYYDRRLHAMLTYKRPHDSVSEEEFNREFLFKDYEVRVLGDFTDPAAYVIEVGGGSSRTMFSCHVDTVHRSTGRQRVKFDPAKLVYCKTDNEPLGADDTAGCWLLLEMIDAGVPGTYVFHRGEERGGIGSSFIADKHVSFLKLFDRAVAFDRRGSCDVITHQGAGRCASDTFAQALADAFNEDGESMYAPSDMGIFTDTANYTSVIPECTNISCGYMHEHTAAETLHLPTLFALRDNCLHIDWESLPTERDPKEKRQATWYDMGRYGTDTCAFNDYDYMSSAQLYQMSRAEMNDMAYTDPETFVDLVRQELFGEYGDETDYKGLRYGN